MKSLLISVFGLVCLLADPIYAGAKFSERVLERYARPEKFAAPRQEKRSLEERAASFKFLTNATKRQYWAESQFLEQRR
jgi:hypothetical protein